MDVVYEKSENVHRIFDTLEMHNIEYVLIRNIDNELPDKLRKSKDIEIMVNPYDKEKFDKVMKMVARKIEHPNSKREGWKYLYDLPEFEFWRVFSGLDLYINVSYKLSCCSLMPKTWMPLDEIIQTFAWREKKWSESQRWWRLSDNVQYVYYICRCVFNEKMFGKEYISAIEEMQPGIEDDKVKEMFNMVFFSFTPCLMELLREKDYSCIREKYLRYEAY